MKLHITTREKFFSIAIVILIIIFFFRECSIQKDKDNLLKSVLTYQDSAKFYKIKVDGNPVDVAFNQSLILENKKQLEALLANNDTLKRIIDKFRSVQSTTIIKEYFTVTHDTIKLPGLAIPCDFPPIHIHRDSLYYTFYGTIAPKYFTIDSLFIPNTQSIVIGNKKLGFLKGTEQRVEIVNSNPLMKTTNIGNYLIQPDNHFYNRTWFKFTVGFVVGTAVGVAIRNP